MSVDSSSHEVVTRPYREAWRRIAVLPLADQLRLYTALKDFLADEPAVELEADQQVDARAAALEAMRAAAEHLRLTRSADGIDPRAVSVAAFDAAWDELGSEWRSARVIKAFGRWNTAKAALIGGRVPQTPSQKAIARSSSMYRAQRTVDHFDAVALWLRSNPPAETTTAYMDFRAAFNDRLGEDGKPLPSYATIMTWTGLSWRAIKQVARKELTLEQAMAERAAQPTAGNSEWGELIGGMQAAAILGVAYPTFEYHARKREFPPHVARVGGRRVWRRADIELYARGKRAPAGYATKKEGELQAEILSRADLMLRLSMSGPALARQIRVRRWDQVPQPEGRIENRFWWWRASKVGAWERERSSGSSEA